MCCSHLLFTLSGLIGPLKSGKIRIQTGQIDGFGHFLYTKVGQNMVLSYKYSSEYGFALQIPN